MPKLYMLVGVPASGKSTWVASQPWARDCAYISTDKFVDEVAAAQGKTYDEVWEDAMPLAVKAMTRDVRAAKLEGKDIIWDQTSPSAGSRAKKLRMLPEYEAIAVVFPTPSEAELKRRLASRPGKTVPGHVMRSMIRSLTVPTEAEGFSDIWFV